jgi:hypothetical protein
MKIEILDGTDFRPTATPAGGYTSADQLLQGLLITLAIESADATTLTLKLNLKNVDRTELLAAIRALQSSKLH